MQDRFKFRVWDKEAKKMFTPLRHFNYCNVNGTIVYIESFCQYDGFYQKRIIKEFNDAILMQCTGLKDKNGKLIYEGDVVRFEEIYECACFTNIKEVLFKIVWNDYSFKAKQIKIIQGNRSYEFPLTLSKLLEIEPYTEHQTTINLEIIGNIYENPELLEDGNE